jgi:hypothetical protein
LSKKSPCVRLSDTVSTFRTVMTQLRALTHDTDPKIGGFLATFPSGLRKEVVWRSSIPTPDALAAAKEFAAGLLSQLIEENKVDDANRTNWPSLVAAIQRIVLDFNARRRASLYALDSSPEH